MRGGGKGGGGDKDAFRKAIYIHIMVYMQFGAKGIIRIGGRGRGWREEIRLGGTEGRRKCQGGGRQEYGGGEGREAGCKRGGGAVGEREEGL